MWLLRPRTPVELGWSVATCGILTRCAFSAHLLFAHFSWGVFAVCVCWVGVAYVFAIVHMCCVFAARAVHVGTQSCGSDLICAGLCVLGLSHSLSSLCFFVGKVEKSP
jgi:hypothetical protein